jgi:ankyrin repeat protein
MRACWKKNKLMVDILLERGAEVNRTNQFGVNALMVAAIQGDQEIFRFLVECNADVMMNEIVSSI